MPNVTEMLFFLNLGPRVVGRSDFCDYPPQAAKLPSVGGMVDTSLEQIVALRPDLVVAYQGNSLELVAQLRKAKLNVVAFKEAATLAEVGEQMRTLHRIASKPGAPIPAELAVWQSRLTKETIKSYPRASYFRFFFGYPGEVAYSAGPGSFIDDLLRRAGASNVVSDTGERWPQLSAEFILAAKPEWILTATACTEEENPVTKQAETLAELRKSKVWQDLPAVKDGNVIVLDSDMLLRPGPRILDALQQLNKALTRAMIDKMVQNAA
jgi:iron complex transport system substrate-binding protein